MPGFIIHIGNDSFSFASETRKKLVVNRIEGTGYSVERRVVNKFMNDRLFVEDDEFIIVVEGVVLNNHQLMEQYAVRNWKCCVEEMYRRNGEAFFNEFRGSFSGALFDKKEDKWLVYTGHTGEKQVFYTRTPDGYLFGSEMRFIVETLKLHSLPVTIDKTGAYLSLTHGFCIEDRTLVEEVHKLIAGHYIRILSGEFEIIQYHRFSNKPDESITKEVAVESIDRLFRQAIRRQFDKDVEYGYRHLACLSGGLDSRMTVWVAHEMGYTDQTNIDFCQSGYVDFEVSQKIATSLHHDYFFHALDGGDFIPRYKFNSAITYGCGFLLGHGYSMEQFINYDTFGLMHTGQIGDAVIGTFFKKNEYNTEVKLGQGAYSQILLDRLSDYQFIEQYENEEIFCLYTRAFTGANQGLLTFQENTESCSPFTDVDFLEYCYSIPLNLRFNHKIYIDWILEKYPGAAEFIWEKIGKVITPVDNTPQHDMTVLGFRIPHFTDPRFKEYLKGFVLRRLGLRRKGGGSHTIRMNTEKAMNPVDYWYNTNPKIRDFVDVFWIENRDIIPYQSLESDMESLITQVAVLDKLQCCNVLSAIKLILS